MRQALVVPVEVLLAAAVAGTATSQTPPPAPKILTATIHVSVSPTVGQSAGQRAQQVTAEQVESFKKAFSVCFEGNKYMAKY